MWNLVGTGGVRTDNSSTMTIEPTERSDSELVARARAGDPAAFGALVGRYQTAALRLAAAISGSVDDAADIAQEAFVKAHRSLPRLSDPAMVRSWMLRIVANEAKNHLRGRDRRRLRDERYGSWVVAAVPDPELSALGADEARGLGLALGRIGARDRQVLAYRYFAGLSEVETAAAAGVAVGTVKSRTARALARLRVEMERQ
jgi:RNA polymerase sigma factor (sigma-70 family)